MQYNTWLDARRGHDESPQVAHIRTTQPATALPFRYDNGSLSTTNIAPPLPYIDALVELAAQGHGGVPEALDAGFTTYALSVRGYGPDYPRQHWDRAVLSAMRRLAGFIDDETEARMFVSMPDTSVSTSFRAPDVGKRDDGAGVFYSSAVNMVYGPPEGGKTLFVSAIAVQELSEGHSVLWVDMDHNGAEATKSRLVQYGVSEDVLNDPARFRFAAPTDSDQFDTITAWTLSNPQGLVIVDSMGELLAKYGVYSDSDGAYGTMHSQTLARIAGTGACVIVIDHTTKTQSNIEYSIGSQRKKAALDGSMLQLKPSSTFVPGVGGAARLIISKDRPGGLRAVCAPSDGKQVAGDFAIGATLADWSLSPAVAGETKARRATQAERVSDVDQLAALDPAPTSVRNIKDRMKWGTTRATAAWRLFSEDRARDTGA
jgi:hypothetical protein